MAYVVAVYLVDKAYGGPEEGGWWFTYGEPVAEFASKTRGFTREHDATRYAARLNRSAFMAELNQGRRDIDSVLSTGIYSAEVSEGNPAPLPAARPHYA